MPLHHVLTVMQFRGIHSELPLPRSIDYNVARMPRTPSEATRFAGSGPVTLTLPALPYPEILCALCALVFLLLKVIVFVPRLSDGYFYLYAAWDLASGQVPYADFFFAHPLGQLIALLPFVALSGPLGTVTLHLADAAQVCIALLLFMAFRGEYGRWIALAGSVFYLFSFTVLATSDHLTGVHLTTLLLVISWLLARADRPALAGTAAALACLVRFYAFPVAAGLAAGIWLERRTGVRRALVAFGVVLFFGLLLHVTLAPSAFFGQAVLYHVAKSAGLSKFEVFLFFLKREWFLLLLGVPGMVILARAGRPSVLLPAACFLLALLLFPDVYFLYLVPLVPWLIAGACASFERILERGAGRPRDALVLLAVLSLFLGMRAYFGDQRSADSVPLLSAVARTVQAQSSPAETLYGNSEVTPLVALLAGRRIAGGFADTNEKIFLTGLADPEQRAQVLAQLGVRFIVTLAFIGQDGRVAGADRVVPEEYLRSRCVVAGSVPVIRSAAGNALMLWDCGPEARRAAEEAADREEE